MTRACILLIMLLPTLAAADVYQWQDANGNTIFSDQPPAHLASSIKKPVQKVRRKRSQRDQDNIRLLPDRERRLLAAMAAHEQQLKEQRARHCIENQASADPATSTSDC